MSKELTVKKDITTEHDLSVIEQVVMQGDLSKLNPIQRVTYYNKVCESMGLNPYTRPFDYISLNGKLTLYAKKDATEQLRQVKRISIISLEGKMVDDLYIVVAKATTPDGRIDQSTGAVNLGNLRGEQKANAIMKAETKAKRRVTLSISGMGWTDESEIDSISNAKPVNVDMETGEVIDISSEDSIDKSKDDVELITKEMVVHIRGLIKIDASPNELLESILSRYTIDNLERLPAAKVATVIKNILARQDKQRDARSVPIEIVNPEPTADEIRAALY